MSLTVTVKPQELVLPWLSSAVQVSVVTPNGKVDPLGGTHAVVITVAHASDTVGRGKETAAPVGPVHSATWLPGHVMEGFVVSFTVIVTVSVLVPPLPSFTVSVITCAPKGTVTVGVAPVAVPNGPVHVNVKGSPFGSLEPLPFNVTDAPAGVLHSIV